MSFFNWHISFERLYFKSSRVEYQVRLWRRVKYRRPEKLQQPLYQDITAQGTGITELTDTTDIEEEK